MFLKEFDGGENCFLLVIIGDWVYDWTFVFIGWALIIGRAVPRYGYLKNGYSYQDLLKYLFSECQGPRGMLIFCLIMFLSMFGGRGGYY